VTGWGHLPKQVEEENKGKTTVKTGMVSGLLGLTNVVAFKFWWG